MELSRRSIETALVLGWTWWVSGQHVFLARIALERDDHDTAEREARAALGIAQDEENPLRTASAIMLLARCALRRGDRRRAGVLWGAARTEFERAELRFDPSSHGSELVAEDDAAFRAAHEKGCGLDL